MRALREEVARLSGKEHAAKRKRDAQMDEVEEESDDGEESQGDSSAEETERSDGEEPQEPRLSRAPPPLPQALLEELTLGRVGVFVAESADLRKNLYTKKWKASASLLVPAKDQTAPKEQQWHLPGKEVSPAKIAELFNKAEGILIHSHPALSFGSETVAKRVKESTLLTKEEREFLKTGLGAEQARDSALLWRAVRLYQEADLTEEKVLDMTHALKTVQRDHPSVWAQLLEEHAKVHPESDASELGSTLPAQHAARTKSLAGSTVALFMESMKQGYRKAHTLSAKAWGVQPEVLGSSLPSHEVLVCQPTMLAEAQANAALPCLGTLPQQRGGAPFHAKRRGKGRRVPTSTRKGKRRAQRNAGDRQPAQTQPPADRGAKESGRPGQDGKPAAPKKKKKKGGQHKKQKQE